MKMTIHAPGFSMDLWHEVKKCSKEYGLSLPQMLQRIVLEWMAGKGRNG